MIDGERAGKGRRGEGHWRRRGSWEMNRSRNQFSRLPTQVSLPSPGCHPPAWAGVPEATGAWAGVPGRDISRGSSAHLVTLGDRPLSSREPQFPPRAPWD